ncbi:MAG: phosphomannomutase/phosphoglucomutase [Bacilli bacterium]
MNFSKETFRSYDVRGIYETEITNELAYLLGQAFGTKVKSVIVVGHDARFSSNALNTNLIKGIISTGCNVIDTGLVTTPMLYFAREKLNIPHSIMITASHCSKEFNGFKLNDEEGSMYGEKIQNVLKDIESGNFNSGIGTLKVIDIKDDYVNLMKDKIKLGNRSLKVVIDCGNGTTSIINPDIIERLGINVIKLNCDNDPNYPNHIPDPAVESNMIQLQKKVKKTKADLGIAFDGDGDRIGIVDEKGNLVKTDMFMLIIWKGIINTAKNKNASFDIKCSKALKEGLENLGLTTHFRRSGHSYLKKDIKENGYDFAGEFSGHVCFADEFYGYDDALYAAGRLLRILSNTNLNVSDYFIDTPKYVTSPETYIKVKEEEKEQIVDAIKKYALSKKYEIITIDGVRIEYDDGFALVRASNTSSSITVRFEGKTKKIMKKYEKEIMDIIKNTIIQAK